ncbi:MAG: Fe-S cluster assembly protein SufD [Solirubrobacteraceae bacterium]|nr:Fe-S cluster assembly protein SufD [Solirubrobacteraceae bacterium]
MADVAVGEPRWLTTRREQGAATASGLGLPQYKGRSGWEFTDLGTFSLDAFAPAAPGEGDAGALDRVETLLEAPAGAVTLAQVDGRVIDVPSIDGPIVLPLDVAAERHPELVEPHLGRIVDSGGDVFAAVNDAGWTGGAFVYVPRGVTVEAPVLLTAISDAAGTGVHRRTLIVLEEGAEAEVWEQYLSGSEDGEALVNTVVEIVVGQNARLRFVSGQDMNEKSWIFGSMRAEVARDGTLDWVVAGFGSARGKIRTETLLAGEGAEGKVTGAYAPHGRQHVDFDTTQEHGAANTTSDLAFRGILADRSVAVWRGMIKVDPGAQRTDAFQECRNLLLSKRAHADAIPGLEILANDVRCTHAAAIAQIDPEQLFYLRSRGLAEGQAKRLVIEGFMAELVERFEQGPIREAMAGALERRLHKILD